MIFFCWKKIYSHGAKAVACEESETAASCSEDSL
jgi:hypothetical protein